MSNNFLIPSQTETVDGAFSLGPVIQRSLRGSIYETEFGDEALPAVIKFRVAEGIDAESLLRQWQSAIAFGHANLLRVYAAGSAVLDQLPVVYVVMERGDESLAGVLAERVLSGSETKEMLEPALSALRYLHQNGYAHGGIRPSNIFAVGDKVKLSVESAVRMEEGGDSAEDVRAFGMVIVRALGQAPLNWKDNTGEFRLANASRSLTEIVEHSLDPDPAKRWTVDQIVARLKGPLVMPAPTLPPAPALEFPVVQSEPPEPAAAPQARRTPWWIYGSLAALVLIVVLIGVARNRNSVPAPDTSIHTADRMAPVPSWPNPEPIPPAAVAPALPPATTDKVDPFAPAARGRRADGWSVIVATYASRDGADKRGRELAQRWRKFTFTVLPQEAEKSYYLIVIGQNLPEEAAEALRRRAVASGIPRDTYIKKTQ